MRKEMIPVDNPAPDCCANCRSLKWGKEEGWDLCEYDGGSIYWGFKHKQKCCHHQRSSLKDPRLAGMYGVKEETKGETTNER